MKDIILLTKCAPEKLLFSQIRKAGLAGVELYLSREIMKRVDSIIKLCWSFPFRYAVHGPSEECNPLKLADLVNSIGAEVVVLHNIYWEDEWGKIMKVFENVKTKICVENTFSIHEYRKFSRRYGVGSCLDLEHLQMECSGVYEEDFFQAIKCAFHIHLTGYIYNSKLWHTHIHQSPQHCLYFLNLLKKAKYCGFVVSEAKTSLQNYAQFKKLHDFFQRWENS